MSKNLKQTSKLQTMEKEPKRMKSNIQYDYYGDFDTVLQLFECKICHIRFEKDETIAWEIHKLNHTLVSLKNIIDRKGERLY